MLILWNFLIIPYNASAAAFQNGGFEANSAAFTDENGYGYDFLTAAEQDFTGWTIQILSGTYVFRTSTDGGWLVPRSGTYSANWSGTDGKGRISQVFDTISGKPYRMFYYQKVFALNSNYNLLATIKNSNSAGTTLATATTRPTSTSAYQLYTLDFTTTSTSTYVSFENTTNSGNDILLDDVSIVQLPIFTSTFKLYVSDPSAQNLKAIPGNELIFDKGLKNDGGVPDVNSTTLTIPIPSNLSFKVGSVTFQDAQYPKSTPTGNASTSYDTVGSSNLTVGTIQYSSVGTSGPWTYTPSGTYDSNVRAVRIKPSGTMNNGNSGSVGFRIYFTAQIQ